jgi:hypothetical protein
MLSTLTRVPPSWVIRLPQKFSAATTCICPLELVVLEVVWFERYTLAKAPAIINTTKTVAIIIYAVFRIA